MEEKKLVWAISKEIGSGLINIIFVRIGSKKGQQNVFSYNLEIVVFSGRIVVVCSRIVVG